MRRGPDGETSVLVAGVDPLWAFHHGSLCYCGHNSVHYGILFLICRREHAAVVQSSLRREEFHKKPNGTWRKSGKVRDKESTSEWLPSDLAI